MDDDPAVLARQPVLTMRGIHKIFPGVKALDGVDFRLFPGEVHALMGENGAGKSTLIKVLTGVYPIDGGEVRLDGAQLRVSGPGEAQDAGISTVYQEVNLCPNLSVAENIFIGREPRQFGRIKFAEMRQRAGELLRRMEIDIDPGSMLGSHSIAIQQMVAIARAINISARVLVLDEPTSSLDAGEVEQLFRVIRSLRADGVAILFVSHFLDQVFEVADRITVLRNGKLVSEHPIAEISKVQLVNLMIGHELKVLTELEQRSNLSPEEAAARPVVAAAQGLGRKGAIAPVDIVVHEGEVFGLAGLLGSGRTEVVRLFFGADHADSGTIEIGGVAGALRSPATAISRGVAFCSEDRKGEGVMAELSVRENIVMAMQAARGWARPISRRKQDELAAHYIEALDIRPANPEMPVGNLSGGNQQKVLLARWLATEPKLLILDEPTRGIDVGAKAQIQELVVRLARDGMAVFFVSAELEEVLRLSDTIGVLRDRTLVASLPNVDLTQESIMSMIASGAES
ncbi:MAG TPA: sugar ABC transporter ATP-binding protein [Kineosporiaceae bacterium]|nr:sugar ABC transporter ATP-binding protein [Kineosporiaceae bacterium]